MTTPRKGIVDPWRVVEPLEKPKKPLVEERRRINLAEFDFEADLRHVESCVFRSRHGAIDVRSKQVRSNNDGLRDLVRCLFQILEEDDGPDLFDNIGVGFALEDREWAAPAAEVQAVWLHTSAGYKPSAQLWFLRQPYDSGMHRLIKLLVTVQRRPGAAGSDILKRWGVLPMLR